jgi:hypothetical protein
MALDFDAANPYKGYWMGWALENLYLFGPKWHSLRLLPFQGPKASIFMAHTFQWP